VGGTAVRAADLSFEDVADAAAVVAEDYEAFDGGVIADATRSAREEVDSGESVTRFVALLFEFVGDRENRGLIYRRLREHVGRRRGREEDVSGLFE
jgi:hypothetical protein